MNTKCVLQSVLFLAFTNGANPFLLTLRQSRAVTLPALLLQESLEETVEGSFAKDVNTQTALPEHQTGKENSMSSQQQEQPHSNNDNIKKTHEDATFWKPHHDLNELQYAHRRSKELQEEVDYWKNRFDQMRFRLVWERRRHKQRVLELRDQVHHLKQNNILDESK